MSETIVDPLEQVIRKAGEEWLIDRHQAREKALPRLREILNKANEWGKKRFGGNAPALTPEAIASAFASNPQRIRGFIQIIASVGSSQFLVMVWRILQGMNIQAIHMEYEDEKPFRLNVRLVSPDGQTEEYESDDIDDAVVLRHLGIMKMGNQGIFDGFYAMKK